MGQASLERRRARQAAAKELVKRRTAHHEVGHAVAYLHNNHRIDTIVLYGKCVPGEDEGIVTPVSYAPIPVEDLWNQQVAGPVAECLLFLRMSDALEVDLADCAGDDAYSLIKGLANEVGEISETVVYDIAVEVAKSITRTVRYGLSKDELFEDFLSRLAAWEDLPERPSRVVEQYQNLAGSQWGDGTTLPMRLSKAIDDARAILRQHAKAHAAIVTALLDAVPNAAGDRVLSGDQIQRIWQEHTQVMPEKNVVAA